LAVRQTGTRWKAFAEHLGKRQSKTFDTKLEAEQWEAGTLAIWGKEEKAERERLEAAPKGTLGDLHRVAVGLDWAGKHQGQAEAAERLIRLHFGAHALPCEIDARAIDDLVIWLRTKGPNGKGCSNGSINRYLSALSVLLKRAQRLGMIQEMPLFPERRLLKESEPRDLVLPEEWLAELLDVMEKKEQRLEVAVTLFLWHMGCRVGEALKRNDKPGLLWDRVNLEQKSISFVKTKGCMPRRLPMPRPVQALMKQLRGQHPERVFPIGYRTYLDHYGEAVHQVCDRLGLSPSLRDEWCIHTLRHTCLTNLARKGWNASAIQQWGGHKSLAVTQRYVHHSAIALEELVDC
jgi:integrase